MPSDEDVTQRAGSLRSMTGLTEAEFTALLPPFEQAFVAYMRDHTIDGHPRASRNYSTYDNCPLPTMADKLLFILTYVKQNPIQDVQGQLFGLSQSNANKWIHLLWSLSPGGVSSPPRGFFFGWTMVIPLRRKPWKPISW